jgi:hypothetical protein
MKRRAAIVAALLLGLCGSASPEEPAKPAGKTGVRVALLAGGFRPARDRVEQQFGDVWPNLDLALF